MRQSLVVLLAAVGLVSLGLAAPASATEPLPITDYFFECEEGRKVRNGTGAAPWSTTAPTVSYASGGGCGYFDQNLLVSTVPANDLVDAVFEGTHTGPVNYIAVRLDDLLLSQAESGRGRTQFFNSTVSFDVTLEIDGRVVFDTTPWANPLETYPVKSASGLTQSIEFSLRFARTFDTTEEHTYRLTIGKRYADTTAAWVFGATEVPGGISFNDPRPSALARAVVRAF